MTARDESPARLPSGRIGLHVKNALLMLASVVASLMMAEAVVRYIDDAMAVAMTEGLPPQAARRVVPVLCRMAIEAACAEAIRRRRLARGEQHAQVEDVLTGLHGTRSWAALALFDTPDRTADVLPFIDKYSRDAADTFRLVNEATHEALTVPPVDVLRATEKLAAWLRAQK